MAHLSLSENRLLQTQTEKNELDEICTHLSPAYTDNIGHTYAQNYLTPQQLKKDFEIFKGSIKQSHPGLYWYSDSATVNERFAKIEAAIDDSLSQQHFHRHLLKFYAAINCGHSWMLSAPSFDRQRNAGRFFFPVALFFDHKLTYLTKSYTGNDQLKKGEQITAIDGHSISEIYDTLYKYIPSDGFITTKKDRIIARNFFFYYQQYFGLNEKLLITVNDPETGKSREEVVEGISKQAYSELLEKNRKDTNADLLSFRIEDDQTGILTIKTFSRSWIRNRKEKNFKKFLAKTFREIREKNVNKLVLDLRNNGGGSDSFGALLTNYLIPLRYGYFDKMELTSKKFSYLDYSDTKHLKLIAMIIGKSKDRPGVY
ncbi:MAG: S41 family peptidase, partial [Cyclobacteriaceae bacterium]